MRVSGATFVLLFSLVALSFGQNDPTQAASNDGGGLGDSEPWTPNTTPCTASERVGFAYEFTDAFALQDGDIMLFDLATDIFNAAPTFSVSFITCDATGGTITTCNEATREDFGNIVADPVGTTNAGDFQFGFRIPAPGYNYLGSAYLVVLMEFVSPDNTDTVTTGDISIGTNDFYFEECALASDIVTDNTIGTTTSVPAVQFITCGFTPRCVVPSALDNPAIVNTDPGECIANVGVIEEAEDLATPNFPGYCPLTLTRVPDPTEPTTNAPFGLGDGLISYTVTNDINGLSSTCTDDFTVQDNEPPVLNCQSSYVVPNDAGLCQANFDLPVDIATDNCNTPTVVSNPTTPDDFQVSLTSYSFTVTATDDGGLMDSCSFTIRVTDVEAPTFPDCPTDIDVVADTGRCSANVEAMINADTSLVPQDNCAPEEVTTNFLPNSDFPVGTTNFVATTSDIEDTPGFCRFQITVTDDQPPTITCPGDITVDTTRTSESVSFNTLTVDNCKSNVVTSCVPASNSRFQVGSTTVDCRAVDVTDNNQFDTCQFNVIVNAVAQLPSPAQTPIELPPKSPSNSQTRKALVSPQVSRDQISPSESRTLSRSNNPSVSPTPSLSFSGTPTNSESNTPTTSGTTTPIPDISSSRTPTRTSSPIGISLSRSPFVPSGSPSPTPVPAIAVFQQRGTTTLVEVILDCEGNTCSQAEAEFYIDAFALALGIDISDIYLEAIFGNEITFIVCDSDDVADLLNDINFGDAPPELAGSIVESAIFEVACPGDFQQQQQQQRDSSDASVLGIGLVLLSVVTLF